MPQIQTELHVNEHGWHKVSKSGRFTMLGFNGSQNFHLNIWSQDQCHSVVLMLWLMGVYYRSATSASPLDLRFSIISIKNSVFSSLQSFTA